jgi:hypothetical protein
MLTQPKKDPEILEQYRRARESRLIPCRFTRGYPRGQNNNFLPSSPSSVYLFSKILNKLDFDPTYPRNPFTLGDYIRKHRKDKGLLIREMAEKIGICISTLIRWEGGIGYPAVAKTSIQ